jgi:hypothetical protein
MANLPPSVNILSTERSGKWRSICFGKLDHATPRRAGGMEGCVSSTVGHPPRARPAPCETPSIVKQAEIERGLYLNRCAWPRRSWDSGGDEVTQLVLGILPQGLSLPGLTCRSEGNRYSSLPFALRARVLVVRFYDYISACPSALSVYNKDRHDAIGWHSHLMHQLSSQNRRSVILMERARCAPPPVNSCILRRSGCLC